MTLKLYNTLTRQKADFKPIDPDNVRMYVCGPTVYDFAHIGNARPVIVFDVLFRLLGHIYGPEHVTYVRNITDVDDKINARALRDFPGLPLNDAIARVTEKTADQFHADVKALGCLEPTYEPRATDNIPQMIDIIIKLLERGHAYVAAGEVLFDTASMPDYGRLSQRNLDEQQAGARVEVEAHKKNPADFVLWKLSSPEEPGWESPWGRGRPGWHIECSAMSGRYLGDVFDIHGGGLDLIFPHHENEIAQSRCAHGTPVMANVWMHNGFLQVEGEKMSKSLGNFVTINALLQQCAGYVIRLNMLQTHYRQPIDWTASGMASAQLQLLSWAEFLCFDALADSNSAVGKVDAELVEALGDDLNTPLAIARLHEVFQQAKSKKIRASDFAATANFLGFKNITKPGYFHPHIMANIFESGPQATAEDQRIFLQFRSATANNDMRSATFASARATEKGFRLSFNDAGVEYVSNLSGAEWSDLQARQAVDNRIGNLIQLRLEARKRKDFAESDRIRDELATMGIALKDTKNKDTGEIETTWEVMR